MILSITGFMGCGKSRVGEKLSGLLSCPVIDLDRYIETKEGRTIPEIFAASGEKTFRLMEKEALGEILSGTGQDTVIISLGGGTVTTPECAEAIRENTLCIYLRATVDTLVGNLQEDCEGRPMLARNGGSESGKARLRARIEELMNLRSGIYESCASMIYDIDGKSYDVAASEIAAAVESRVR